MILNPSLLKLNKIPLLLALTSIALYTCFAYDLERTEYTKLIMLYAALFFLFYKLVQICKNNFSFLVTIAVIFRVIFVFSVPNLSQDFYRFIWDGRMILEGFNPYLFTVESFISKNEFPIAEAQELYIGMGTLNASHFTNYPPINQLCFVIAGLFAGKSILGSVVAMRVIIVAADLGTLFFGKRLLERLNIPIHNIFWYILNPFIIIELTGNLHFESVMIFFLIWSLYLLHTGKWLWAAVVFALSISVKLIPLIFLPLFFQWFMKKKITLNDTNQSSFKTKMVSSLLLKNRKAWVTTFKKLTKLVVFYLIICITITLLFLPFYSSQFINNYATTVGLWFLNFEFNASLYYIARAIGYTFRGYNEIAIIGKITPLIVILFTLIITFFKRNKTMLELIPAMLLVLSFYYFTTTTVHPWYVATLLILSIFTNYKFPLVWSFVIIFSYLTYANADNTENLWIIGLEYMVVYSTFFYELIKRRPIEN
jgi:alpha-1,6-mannosyltransferase